MACPSRWPSSNSSKRLGLLGKWTERDRVELDRLPAEAICRGVDRLALGVAMCGAMIRQGDEQRWQDVLTLLQTADLERIKADFGDRYPHPTPLAAIQLGIDELPDEPTLDRAASATANSQYSRGADRSPAPPRRRCGWRGERAGHRRSTLAARRPLTNPARGARSLHTARPSGRCRRPPAWPQSRHRCAQPTTCRLRLACAHRMALCTG